MTDLMSRSEGGDLPPDSLWLGWAGALPFLLLALGAWSPQWRDPAVQAFLAYSALILSFLGGVRWGRAMAGSAAPEQFAGAVLPSLWGWLAWLALPPVAALWMLASGFALLAWWDGRSDSMPAPASFRRLRRGLSAAVLGCHALALAGLWLGRS